MCVADKQATQLALGIKQRTDHWLDQSQCGIEVFCKVLTHTFFLRSCACVRVRARLRAGLRRRIWSSDLCFVVHGFPRHLDSHKHWAVTPYIFTLGTPHSFPPSFPLLSACLSFSLFSIFLLCIYWCVKLFWDGGMDSSLMGWAEAWAFCSIIDSGGGARVYLSIVIDYRLVLDNKPHSDGQTDSGACFSDLLGMICCLVFGQIKRSAGIRGLSKAF